MELEERIASALRLRDKAVCETGTYAEYAQAALAAIRETHVLAPREPTEAMLVRGREVFSRALSGASSVYTAMIEAAEGNGCSCGLVVT